MFRPRSMTRRQLLRFSAALSAAGVTGSRVPGVARAAAAIKLTSVSGMVAEAEVAWEKEVQQKWNRLHPEAPWERENIGWETLFEKVLAYEKAGSPPNLGYGWTGFTADWHRMGIIDAPEDYLGQSWKDRFADDLTKGGGDVIGGKLWAVPIHYAFEGLACRRDWLREVSVDPYSIRTWDHLAEAVAKVARAKRNKPYSSPLGLARSASERTEWLLVSNGLNNHADFDPAKRAAYIQVLEMLLRLRPYIPDDAFSQDYTGHRQAFATGVAGFIPIGDYYFGEQYPTAKSLMTKEHVVFIPYPSGPKGPGPVVFFSLNSYYMMAHAKNKEKTAELIEFLTRRENLLRWSISQPPLKQWTVDEAVGNRLYGEAERWWLEDLLALRTRARVVATVPFVAKNEVQQVFYEHLLKVLDRKMTSAEAYDTMKPKITALTKGAGG